MKTEFTEITPRQILKMTGLYREKPTPDVASLSKSIDTLPVFDRSSLEVVGTGDYSYSNSTKGSVVLSNDKLKVVFKLQLGSLKNTNTTQDVNQTNQPELAISQAVEMKGKVKLHDKHVPTDFFIANIDGQTKIVTVQKKSGQPICDKTLFELTSPDLLSKSNKIMKQILFLKSNYGFDDFVGLSISDPSILIQKLISYLIYNTPWFSDNIMVNQEHQIEITDNTPRSKIVQDKSFKYMLKQIKSQIMWKTICVMIKTTRFLFNFNHKEIPSLHSIKS